jgi:hypothetical protein
MDLFGTNPLPIDTSSAEGIAKYQAHIEEAEEEIASLNLLIAELSTAIAERQAEEFTTAA